MFIKTSPLWNILNAKDLLFRAHTGAKGALGDRAITSISITRGHNSAEPNVPISTCQYTVQGEFHDIVGSRSLIEMTDYGAKLVASMAGNVRPEDIKTRFWGRTGIVSVQDSSPDKKLTTIQSSSWLSVAKQSKFTPEITIGKRVGQVAGEAIAVPNLRDVYSVKTYGNYRDTVFSVDDQKPVGFGPVIEKYGLATGLQIVEINQRREVQLWTLEERAEAIKKAATSAPHLTRSAAISPARHSQNIDQWNYFYETKVHNSDGTLATLSFPAPVDRNYIEKKDIDLTYIRRNTPQVYLFTSALWERTTRVRTTPESITVDILALLTSESQHHRHQAGYLLALNPKDPVFFSGDWQEFLRGVYTAEQIKETITHKSWTIELLLFPTQWTLGQNLDAFAPAPQTWEAAGELRWNSPEVSSKNWNQV